MTTLTHLECTQCGATYAPPAAPLSCPCGAPLLARYDLERARKNWNRAWLAHAPSTMWRYAPVLPLKFPEQAVSLGEGLTPLLPLARWGRNLGLADLWLKNEACNPTGSYEARTMSCAISKAKEDQSAAVSIAASGYPAEAMSAYAAAAGLPARVLLLDPVSEGLFLRCSAYGAVVHAVPLRSRDRTVGQPVQQSGCRDLGAFAEPYRLEGMKTLGYEVAEQFHWRLPDVIVCPLSHGMTLVGLWKAFEELDTLGWAGSERPTLIAVRAGARWSVSYASGETGGGQPMPHEPASWATGFPVEPSLGEALAWRTLTHSRGAAVTVPVVEIAETMYQLARIEGLLLGPEGAACLAALCRLLAEGLLVATQRILVINSGASTEDRLLKLRAREKVRPVSSRLGGLITPR